MHHITYSATPYQILNSGATIMHEIQACGPLRSDYTNGETRLAWEDYVNNANTET